MYGSPTPLSAVPLLAQPGVDEAVPAPTLQSPLPASDEELQRRCILDTAERSATGILIYPVVWLSLTMALGIDTRWPLMTWCNLGGLVIMAVLRMVVTRQLARWLTTHRQTAERAFNTLTLLTSFYWGALTGLCMARAPGSGIAWIMLAVTVGFTAGGNTMFAINPRLRYPYPFAMVVPVVVAQCLMPTLEHVVMLVVEVVFVFYLRRASGIVFKDYWDARHAQRLSEQQARALELASLTDGLTQLPNRSYFDRQYAYEWARQCRYGGPVSILMVDIDHFKRVNDAHGHPFGDQCLKAIAAALLSGFGRSTDFVARFGGEEFVALLPETDAEGARVVAERMLQKVREIQIDHNGVPVPLTCSIGQASTIPFRTKAKERLIEDADRALYRAKNAGRDRLIITDSSNEIPSMGLKA